MNNLPSQMGGYHAPYVVEGAGVALSWAYTEASAHSLAIYYRSKGWQGIKVRKIKPEETGGLPIFE
jgi:hypothetical protein